MQSIFGVHNIRVLALCYGGYGTCRGLLGTGADR